MTSKEQGGERLPMMTLSARIQHPEHQFGSFAHALQALAEAKPHSPAVAQTVGFGIGKSNILYLSMGID
jgi:hypothetical protein